MSSIGNIIWFLTAGFWQAIFWTIAGLICSITIIGIPFGRQCFKFASLWMHPFDQDVEFGGGIPSACMNIIWICVCGLWMALAELVNGFVLCCTIIGIPFGLQCFKLAKLSLMPFGAEVVRN